MTQFRFKESEIPYEILHPFGLTQEMVEDLPIDVLDKLLDGRPSPLLPIEVVTEDGETIKTRSRFSLTRCDNGHVDILFYPVLDEYQLEEFNDKEKEMLLSNKPIISYIQKDKGDKNTGSKCFIQLDPETKQVLSVPTPVIGQNLQNIAKKHNLIASELQLLKNCEILTFEYKNQKVSLGIDLNSKSGIRFAVGNEEDWKKESKREWNKYTFGAFGCWVMDDDGNLEYIKDENFTQEMWDEQKKQSMKMHNTR